MSVQNICSKDAYNMLVAYNNAFLIDVRTKEEWKGVGIPSVENKVVVFLSWQLPPFMELNDKFEDDFLTAIHDKISSQIFSGVSHLAKNMLI